MMRVLKVKGLWQRVIKNVEETSSRANRVTINLDLNLGRERTYNIISVEKWQHMKRDCLEKKKWGLVSENKEGLSKSANVVTEEDSENGDGDMLSVSSSLDHLTDSWILDLACSYHMTPNKDWFNTYNSVNSGSVLMGNDVSCKVAGIRNIIIKMFDGVVRTLCDIKHVPNLRKNLISLGILDCNRFSYKSTSRVMKVSKGAMTVMKGQKLAGNIYKDKILSQMVLFILSVSLFCYEVLGTVFSSLMP